MHIDGNLKELLRGNSYEEVRVIGHTETEYSEIEIPYSRSTLLGRMFKI